MVVHSAFLNWDVRNKKDKSGINTIANLHHDSSENEEGRWYLKNIKEMRRIEPCKEKDSAELLG